MHAGGSYATSLSSSGTRSSWKETLANAVREPAELLRRLGLPEDLLEGAHDAARLFPLVVPEPYLRRIRRGDPADPLLLQVLPLGREAIPVPGFVEDPVGDRAARHAPGLIQKYAGRVLLIASPSCAIHCRYCFRRHHPYADEPRGIDAWEPALRAIEADPSIAEVILSGGDPLTLPDPPLARLVSRLASIDHVRRLRIHSRLPVVIPERVESGLLEILRGSRLVPWIVVHANHPREIDAEVGAAFERIAGAGIPVLNQSVLLHGVNDDAQVLAELCELLVDHRVRPYYLHQLDPVAGAAHFLVSEARGREILAELATLLPGYAVPRWVREIPGRAHKCEIA